MKGSHPIQIDFLETFYGRWIEMENSLSSTELEGILAFPN